MKPSSWRTTIADWAFGRNAQTRSNVLLLLATAQLYAVTLAVLAHSVYLGLIERRVAEFLCLCGTLTFGTLFVLVRSGWSQKLKDPILAFPHALVSILICIIAFTQLGEHRANVLILIGQTIVVAMFWLKPAKVLMLGAATVVMLTAATMGMNLAEPARYEASASWAILVLGGSCLLMLSLIAKWVSSIGVRLSLQAQELADTVQTLEKLATTDMLTGLLNRRVMTDLLEDELRLIGRTQSPACVALIDLDHFKEINDRFGHHAGDTALKEFAQCARQQLRKVDQMSRWGGEEFILLLPQLNQEDALKALERLRGAIEALVFKEHGLLHLTFSAGIAQALPGESLEQLVDRADKAVYEAKKLGRNRCVLAVSEAEEPSA